MMFKNNCNVLRVMVEGQIIDDLLHDLIQLRNKIENERIKKIIDENPIQRKQRTFKKPFNPTKQTQTLLNSWKKELENHNEQLYESDDSVEERIKFERRLVQKIAENNMMRTYSIAFRKVCDLVRKHTNVNVMIMIKHVCMLVIKNMGKKDDGTYVSLITEIDSDYDLLNSDIGHKTAFVLHEIGFQHKPILDFGLDLTVDFILETKKPQNLLHML